MSSGVGRGRGWLNLKAQSAKTPGPENNTILPVINHISSPNFNSHDNRTFSDASSDYVDLISKIKLLNINDDGIKFNQKIKYIVESWIQDCHNGVEVEKSFEAIHESSLADADMASKLVLLISSRTFLSQEIHEQNIRLMFLRKLQDNFEGGAQLQSSNPKLFRNSVQLMGEFFNKARLANGQQFSFMATPLLSYLEMLLESAESDDLRIFAIQLYLNGNSLKQECPEKVADLLSKIRLMLCLDKRCMKECKLWLLLSLEVSNNRFALLPADIQKFYQEQLGDHEMACFQGLHGALTVQTAHNSKTLDNFQSNVNVLQVTTDSSGDTTTSPHNSITDSGILLNASGACQSDLNSDKKDNNKVSGIKSGRPILGAGARLHKNRNQTTDSSDNWDTEKSQTDSGSSNWNRSRNQNSTDSGNWHKSKSQKENPSQKDGNWRDRDSKRGSDNTNQKKEWEKKKTPPKSKKGWEHDDRFDTDYS